MKRYFFLLSCFSGLQLFAQTNDSIKENQTIDLEQTVISGQYNRQSVKKSIYEVRVIDREMIERQAGNTLADILNQTLNMNIIPNSSSGKSSVQMFGLDGQYFKILVDNIPLVNDEGLGNNTDLTQINLDDIQQIEIVEGAMGVEYGANSIAGVINIITKKGGKSKFDISASLQEETIGDEYNWKNKGRHIQSLKIGHNFTDNIYANLSFSRNDFQGFFNDKKGENYPINDGLRGYEWLPKIQNSTKALVQYKKENYRLFYKFEYFTEETKRYDSNLIMNAQPETDTNNPTANDNIFTTNRIYNHLNASGRFKNTINYDVSFSYQEQKRKVKDYNYEILTGNELDVVKQDYESRKVYYSKGLFSNFINKNDFFDFQFGYEIDQTKGFASPLSGEFLQKPIARQLGTYDVFASSEINLNDKISFRPGARVMFSEQFDTQYVLSLSAKYLFGKDWELRGIVGTSPRLPNYDEMYSYFVDVNHNVQGNDQLNPEKGISAFLHLKRKWKINANSSIEQKLSAWKINLKDKISLIVVEDIPLKYMYKNIDTYDVQGLTYLNLFKIGRFTGGFGATLTGKKQAINQEDFANDVENKYFYTVQANGNVSYQLPKTETIFTLLYKYNGSEEQYVQKNNPDNAQEQILVKGKQQAFSWFDASIKQSFFKNKFDFTIGARNLFDVKNLRNTALSDNAHASGANSMLYGYGRSYFVKLTYNLSIN
ncbi:outer membrane receptor for ferrienterochelin and colicins [Algoriella xinjiangensis]|uniref:Outer membrane receptor for ferrienterochelin and colicins n=1 Tax=Algoriella xinjiangensis TaxID=684065 RepID=A0A1I4WAY5_9FLAO|nr:TonB-dependent receptor plug domain-containing protein [Algoriella xinjiangensis]SFN10390.1 outer membrane receptor for ferrienterochelin and colicins [Algoriella xinjiangensis]